jgi:hypothetical protein
MRTLLIYLFIVFTQVACSSTRLAVPERRSVLTGSDFYQMAAAYNWKQRDSLVVREILSGNVPSFLKKLIPVQVRYFDSTTQQLHRATFFVTPDYLAVGTDDDWARVCITPMAAQKIADTFNCFIPTRKIVDDIYAAARVRLSPVPMFAYRDSTPTMYQHHLVVEGQRKGRDGLIAGIKKDVVTSGSLKDSKKAGRVAIYGWHLPGGKPIQPLYTGHVNWYVDYSHGIRLVYQMVRVGNNWLHYTAILADPVLRKLLCDEAVCDFYKYPY